MGLLPSSPHTGSSWVITSVSHMRGGTFELLQSRICIEKHCWLDENKWLFELRLEELCISCLLYTSRVCTLNVIIKIKRCLIAMTTRNQQPLSVKRLSLIDKRAVHYLQRLRYTKSTLRPRTLAKKMRTVFHYAWYFVYRFNLTC